MKLNQMMRKHNIKMIEALHAFVAITFASKSQFYILEVNEKIGIFIGEVNRWWKKGGKFALLQRPQPSIFHLARKQMVLCQECSIEFLSHGNGLNIVQDDYS
uniref:Uncharacterized protein n=1 Tax=Glossina palpalis gambiensis TaxID=67801 RepID=A0A1B0BQG8_9MUSC